MNLVRKIKVFFAQRKAKKKGHCLCNLRIKCPCTKYLREGVCVCAGDK